MAMGIADGYSAYASQGRAGAAGNRGTGNLQGAAGVSRRAEYARELARLVPSAQLRVGSTFPSAKSGKTLTVHPRLLEKMQNDPMQKRETEEMIRGLESITSMMDGIYKATGKTVVYRHGYIDENGKYCQASRVRNDYMLNLSKKLREERRRNSDKLIKRLRAKKK